MIKFVICIFCQVCLDDCRSLNKRKTVKEVIILIFDIKFLEKMCDEGEMIKFINVARQHPTYFISLIDKQLQSFINDKEMPINEDMIYETNEGKSAWKEARKFLEKQNSLPPFEVHEGLNLSAKEHAIDLAVHNLFGHTGSDKSTFSERILKFCKKGQGAMAEIIGADFYLEGRNHAEMTILGLIIDDGVADRGHRKTIFNSQYRCIGCRSQIQSDKVITVFNLTESKLQIRGPTSTISQEGSRFGVSTSGCFAPRNGDGVELTYTNTEPNNVKKEVELKQKKGKTMFGQIEHNLSSIRSSLSPDRLSAVKGQTKNGKKVSEKKENIKIYYEDGAKVTEKYTQILYSDGSKEENIEKHTIYA